MAFSKVKGRRIESLLEGDVIKQLKSEKERGEEKSEDERD